MHIKIECYISAVYHKPALNFPSFAIDEFFAVWIGAIRGREDWRLIDCFPTLQLDSYVIFGVHTHFLI